MNKQEILKKLRTLKPELQEQYAVSELALFGSYSRDEQTSNSDIDIMIDFSKPIGMKYFDVVYLLHDSFGKNKVEVVSKKAIKQKYFDRIKYELLYA